MAQHQVLRAAVQITEQPKGRVLNVVAHPDDEAIGCPATLLALQAAGHEVEIVVCSLGRPDQVSRRREELLEAATRGGFGVITATPPMNLSDRKDVIGLERTVKRLVIEVCNDRRPVLVLAPHPHDVHPAHELVGRAVARALPDCHLSQPILWLWSIWGDLAVPTLYVPFDDTTMDRILEMLHVYEGEVARNDYRRLVEGRGAANTVIGSERIFGFDSKQAHAAPYAELLTELACQDGKWIGGFGRVLAPNVLYWTNGDCDLSWIFERPSYAAEATERSGVTR